jgi:transcriptional regulator with XRE-family HTH domain
MGGLEALRGRNDLVGTARTLHPKRLGQKLAAIRMGLRLSQAQLIRKLGFHNLLVREEISSFERNVRVPPPLVLLEIARVAGVHVDDLLDDEVDLPEPLRGASKGAGVKRKR